MSHMNSAELQRVVEEDLDEAEQAVVTALHDWLLANPDMRWEVRGRKNIEQCSGDGLEAQRSITKPLSTRVCHRHLEQSDETDVSSLLKLPFSERRVLG